MINISRLRYPLVIVAVVALSIWFTSINSALVEQLRSQGKDYNVGIATISPQDGKNGESAYDIAVRHGYKGTELEWIRSLSITTIGNSGKDGASAYQLAVASGFNGSLSDWLNSLKGQKGESIKGDPGTNGQNGANGTDGKDGKDGQNGTNGTNGIDGRTPELDCRENTVVWKYTDEDDTHWRPLYKVTSCSTDPVIQ